MTSRELRTQARRYGASLADLCAAVVPMPMDGESAEAVLHHTLDALADQANTLERVSDAERFRYVAEGVAGFRDQITIHWQRVEGMAALAEMDPASSTRN